MSGGKRALKKMVKVKKKSSNKTASEGSRMITDELTSEDYIVGQVAGSLHLKTETNKASNKQLRNLFNTTSSDVQPVFVSVPHVNSKKRKLNEDELDNKTKTKQSSEPGKNTVKPVAKKKFTAGEKKVADRENSLKNADEEEAKKETKANMKKSRNRLLGSKQKAEDENLVDSDEKNDTIHKKKRINQAAERIKNKRTVFVGNIPTSCTKQMLKSIFKEFGHIESLRFRSVARAEPTISKKLAAIQNGMEMQSGFHIRVDLAAKSSMHDHKRSIFVGNLSYETEEEMLREHFSQCGKIVAVRIVRDRETGLGKGFGYVLFENKDAVYLALKLNHSDLNGRSLRVKQSMKKEKLKPGSKRETTTNRNRKHFSKKKKHNSAKTFTGEMVKAVEKKIKKKKKFKGKKA
ncbi:RNA-binding protein 34 isoform X3 [Latimeria chalumnae]|uniref:RNA-binding protein 34 isoform X3 n=1 Tax=Latimeria chalumnae TaxID=7897 RepID=UPI0003C11873|nr:PREDICTED: RNA-binding protein 34 isoform X3 [Latimeria chalumnae]|eukprot:XP_005993404.1 PREDICTED: RNA-binding protein 34 isoform X3 [Latimeria chalumnae]